MKLQLRISSRSASRLLAGFVLVLGLATAVVIWRLPVPQLAIDYKDTSIAIRADRTWSLGPGDCLQIAWIQEGKHPVHIDGVERRETGQEEYCPAVFAPSPAVELTDHRNGVYESFSLPIQYLPDFLVNLTGVSALAIFPMLALSYLWINDLSSRPCFKTILLAILAIMLGIALLRLSGRAVTIVGVLAILRVLFPSVAWQYAGVSLALALYLLLGFHALRQGFRNRRVADLVAVGTFLAFIGLLYLPFGFDTIGQWEEWFGRGIFEGNYRRRVFTELSQRFGFMVSHALGFLLNTESFSSHNMLHAFFLWGKLALIYGIMRCLGVRQLSAFLVTMLFGAYPVDSGLMSLRSIALQFSILNLLTAIYLVVQYLRSPTRMRLAGVWLALALSVGAYEVQYALIVVFPILWWYRIRSPRWRVVNVTVIWYLVPALKFVYLVLLVVTGRSFYRSNYLYAGAEIQAGNLIPTAVENLLAVYLRTFILGWVDALTDLARSKWLPLTVIIVVLFGIAALYLWRRQEGEGSIGERQLIVGLLTGLLLIIPAVGVLIWFGYYSQDLWRLYLYVPGPAAIAMFSLIALMAGRIRSDRLRNGALIIACLLLMFPASSRLILQHEHFVDSANNKRHILQQIVQLAPGMEKQTRVLVLSDMPAEVRLSKHIEDMKSNMIGDALYVIYDVETSGLGSMCLSVESCYPIANWAGALSDTLVFLLDDDLSLDLVQEPEKIFSAFDDLNYDVTRLYNPLAPLPRRAFTMLGLSRS